MTGIWETADTITKARMNEKTIFQGTGSAISGLASTYPGMLAFCTSSGSGFISNTLYTRNTANDGWITDGPNMYFGDGTDGDVTISSNTDLGSSNFKQYNNLTINSGVSLTGNSGMIIKIKGVLTFGSSTSTINVNGKGGAGGANSSISALNGGSGGGMLFVYANTISGTGKIQANGDNGATYTSPGVTTSGANGTDGYNDGSVATNSKGLTTPGGKGGGASSGNGGDGGGNATGTAGTGFTTIKTQYVSTTYGAGGAGGSSDYTSGSIWTVMGSGGGGGGYLLVMVFDPSTAITLEAKGGNGGNGAQQTGAGYGAGAGGGGTVILIHSKTNNTSISVAGGTGGISSSYSGPADDGNDGSVGASKIYRW